MNVYVDVDGSLGSLSTSTSTGPFDRVDISAEARRSIQQLRARGVSVVAVLRHAAEVASSVDSVLRAGGGDELLDDIIRLPGDELDELAKRVTTLGGRGRDQPSSPMVFVSGDAVVRRAAMTQGFRASPHLDLAWPVLHNAVLTFVRITLPRGHTPDEWKRFIQTLPIVSFDVSVDRRTRYAVTTDGTVEVLREHGFDVARLGPADAPSELDVYFVAPESHPASSKDALGSALLDNDAVLDVAPGGWYVGLRATSMMNAIAPLAGPDLLIRWLHPLSGDDPCLCADIASRWQIAAPVLATAAHAAASLTPDDPLIEDLKRSITPATLKHHVDRYAGVAPLNGVDGPSIKSRHAMKACDNIAAVGQLAADFSKLGLRAATTRVQYPGSGYFPRNVEAKLDSDINPEAVVLITAHLDSTAKKDTNYRPAQDDAPGADDDASGIAAVLACAEALRAVRGNTISKAAIRLVCFNVEEDGFNGSRAFAKGVAASGVLLLGVLQLDMLGYPAPVIDGTQAFEVHAGHSNADVQQWSSALGAIVCELAQRSASGLGGRLYPRGACSDAGNGSSDHASFQNCGWGACAISEAFFGCVEAPSEPPYRNPNYHTSSDTSVDVDYAAAIARVVAASAIKIADAYDSCH